jgi:Na+/H+-dicarboxylate symporter
MRPSVVGAPGRPPVPVIGPSGGKRLGRWKASVPLWFAAVSLVSAAPILMTAILVLVGMPALATAGDLRMQGERQRGGLAAGVAAAPLHLVKNLLLSVFRSVLPIAFLAGMVGIWYLLEKSKISEYAPHWLRASGAATALMVLQIAANPGRIRTSEGMDEVLARITTPSGRLAQAGWVLWIVCIALTAAGLLFTPDPFPLTR